MAGWADARHVGMVVAMTHDTRDTASTQRVYYNREMKRQKNKKRETERERKRKGERGGAHLMGGKAEGEREGGRVFP